MMPDLDTLSDLVLIAERWEKDGSAMNILMEQLLPVVQRILPEARALRLFDVSGTVLRPMVIDDSAETDEPGTVIPAEYINLLKTNSPGQVQKGWVLPLFRDGQLYAVLEVTTDRDLPSAEGAKEWLAFIAQQIHLILQRSITHQLIHRQKTISDALTRCTTIYQIADVLGKHLLQPGHFIAINLLRIDPDSGQMAGFQTVATANRHRANEVNNVIDLTLEQAGRDMRRAIKDGETVLIRDVPNDPEIDPKIKYWTPTKPIQSACIFPIRYLDTIFALLNLNTVGRELNISPIEMELLQALVDQIGVVIRSTQLLEQSQQTQQVATQQIETNRTIAIAEDYGGMAQAMLNGMPASVKLISFMLYDRPATPDDLPDKVVTEVIATRDSVAYPRVADDLTDKQAVMATLVERQLGGEPIITPDIVHREDAAMPNSLYSFADMGARSLVTVGLRIGRRLLGALVIGSPQDIHLDQAELQNIISIADQAAVIIENRLLLRNVETSLEEARTLYEISRELQATDTPIGILRVIHNHLAQDADSVAYYSLRRDPNQQVTAIVREAFIKGDLQEITTPLDMPELVQPQNFQTLSEDRLNLGRSVDMVENLAQVVDERPALRFAYSEGVRSSISIPIFDADHIAHQITVSYKKPRTFNEQIHRLYDATRDQLAIILENRRLLQNTRSSAENLENQVKVLEIINTLVSNLSSTQDEQLLMTRTCEALVNALKIEHVNMVMLSEDRKLGTVVSEYPSMGGVGITIDMSSPEQQRTLETTKPVFINDLDPDKVPELTDDVRQMLKRIGAKAIARIPMFDSGGKYIGFVGLAILAEGKHFTRQMVDTARTIVNQLVISLQNLRLLSGSQRQARQMEGIAGFSQSIQATLDVANLLEVALITTPEIISMEHIAVLFYDPVKGRLQTVAWQDTTGQIHVNLNDGPHFELSNTTAEFVWQRQTTLQVKDLKLEKTLRYTFREDMRSVLSLPIFSRGVALGVIEVAHTEPNRYSTIDSAVFQQLVSQLSVAIENSQAYSQSQKVAMSKALVNEITDHLQRQTGIDQILQTTVHELGKALGAKRARIRLDASSVTSEDQG